VHSHQSTALQLPYLLTAAPSPSTFSLPCNHHLNNPILLNPCLAQTSTKACLTSASITATQFTTICRARALFTFWRFHQAQSNYQFTNPCFFSNPLTTTTNPQLIHLPSTSPP
jgi:hypothetical protein